MRELTASQLVAVATRSDTGSHNRLDLIQSLVPPHKICNGYVADIFDFQEMNMGQRASDTRGITFEDVVVPAEVFIISGSNKFLHVHINYSIATLHSVKNRIRVMVF